MQNENEKSYTIKVPVYTSEPILGGQDLFGGVTYQDMIHLIHKKIDEYNGSNEKVYKNKKNKIQKKEIGQVTYINRTIGDRPCVMLKISAYNTNLHDGYVETDNKIILEQNNKIGSDNFYVLLAPNIIGIDNEKYTHQWIFLLYEDPHKDTQDTLSTIKLVINKILGFSASNIKLPDILDDLKRLKLIPELVLNFSALSYDTNEVDARFRTFLIASELKKQKENKFKDVPFGETEEMINDNSYLREFSKRIVKIIAGKKEYRITQSSEDEAKDKLKQTAEEIFNESIGITKDELINHVYDHDFIIEKLTPVLENYLSS